MSRRPFHRWMSHLALGAALSLSLLPAAGRMFGADGAHAAHEADAGARNDHRGHDAKEGRERAPSPTSSAAADCGYCPLLAAAVTPSRRLPAVARLPAAAARFGDRADPRPLRRHPAGLGSRGPPNA
ncbi:DUF2946 family protein [Luteimonas sp. SJ-92]|uniref:DUF2946 family protein n=1 Tax=Luteimonas salinisoli TaxID=2752307 RepID=A0A853JIJ0_9GAMM|nr:DUF2946 family protein [Luteimonas salinisoli]NZA28554.1 DUF2946 family protein [Luteimonas salinisoli]